MNYYNAFSFYLVVFGLRMKNLNAFECDLSSLFSFSSSMLFLLYICILSVSLCVFFYFTFFFPYKFTCFIANCWFIFYAKRRRFEMSQSWRLTNRFNFVFQWKILVYSWIFYPPFSFLTPIAIRLFILSFSTFYILYTRLAID